MITVQVKKNQIIAAKSKLEPMTSGSQNVYPIQFVFSAEWKYLEKVAVFATELGKEGPGNSVWNVLIDDNDRCFVPWEVNLVHSNHVYVGVYGTRNGNVILPTAWADLGNVILGVTTGLDTEPPTPDIHDQILGKLLEVKTDVANYKTDTDNLIATHQTETANLINAHKTETATLINNHKSDVTALVNGYQTEMGTRIDKYTTDTTELVNKYRSDTNSLVNKYTTDTTELVNKYRSDTNSLVNKYTTDTTNLVNKHKADMASLFENTTAQIRDDAFGKIAEIRRVVEDFTNSGLQVINGATIVNRNDFPDKVIPIDSDGDGIYDKTIPIDRFPRSFILTNTTIASNAGDSSRSWSFANELVYVQEKIYVDENQNEIPAIYLTDMAGTTYAFLTDDSGNFNDMIEVVDPPIHYEDIVDKPNLSDVTRMKCIAITLRQDQWTAAVEVGSELGLENSDEDPEMLPQIVTQVIRMWGISEAQRDQLIVPVPRQDCEGAYYGSNIKLAGQDLNTLYFRAWNGIPDKDLVVYIYVANATSYEWIDPPPPPKPGTSDCDCCIDYKFEEGLVEESNVEGQVLVRVDTVDDFTGNMNLPMSAKGVYEILGNIERLINKL